MVVWLSHEPDNGSMIQHDGILETEQQLLKQNALSG